MKKILFFSQNYVRGGVLKVFTDLVKNWPGENDDITVGVNKANKCFQYYEALKSERVKIWPIPIKSNRDKYNVIMRFNLPKYIRLALIIIFIIAINPLWFVRDVLYFCRQIRKRKLDVVISNNGGYPGGELCLRIVIAAKLAKVENIILIIHNYPRPKNIFNGLFWSVFDRVISYSCSSIISVSKDCADTLNKKRSFTKKVNFIYNGIEFTRDSNTLEQKREILGIKENEKIIGALGNLERRKGFYYLILAMNEVIKKFPESRLIIIIGSDVKSLKSELENLIEKNNLGANVTLIDMAGAAPYFECFDVAVVPSIAFESFGLVCLEAMYYKKPVIGTSIGGIPEVIKDGETGFIVPPKEERALAEKIIYLLSHPEKSRQMRENGKERLKLFTVEKMAHQYFSMTI